MARAIPIVLVLLILSGSLGCANRRPASSLSARILHTGFSTDRPPNDNWYLNLSEVIQSPDAALYRRDVPNEAQRFGFFVRFIGLAGEPRSDEEFTTLVSHTPAQGLTPGGATILSNQIRPEPHQGHYCVRFTMTTTDKTSQRYPSRLFYLRSSGLYCRHPDHPREALIAAYAERSTTNVFDESLAAEGELLLQSLQIEVDQ